jgi:hypothetical protein
MLTVIIAFRDSDIMMEGPDSRLAVVLLVRYCYVSLTCPPNSGGPLSMTVASMQSPPSLLSLRTRKSIRYVLQPIFELWLKMIF